MNISGRARSRGNQSGPPAEKRRRRMMGTGISALLMDVDGTLTDGKIYISAEGEGFKAI